MLFVLNRFVTNLVVACYLAFISTMLSALMNGCRNLQLVLFAIKNLKLFKTLNLIMIKKKCSK